MEQQQPPDFALASEHTSGLAWPWRRYWARMLDLVVGFVIVGFAIGFLRPSLFEPGGAFDGPWGDRILTILSLPFALLIDAVIYRVCGNTAGKALAGIRTVHEDGQAMSLLETVKRNLTIWFAGLGLGVPIITLITLVNAHGKGKHGLPCGWEVSSGARSFSDTDSTLRTTFVAFVFLVLTVTLSAVGQAYG